MDDKLLEAQIRFEKDPVRKAELQAELDKWKTIRVETKQKRDQKKEFNTNFKKVANFFGIKGIFWKVKSYILIAVITLILVVFYIMRRGVVT